ncbi:hypothetical protein UA08_02232 [Talaromyces atroroseus]|uniref:D-lactate dehydratase n=1 Tax=Talaromyces atroroseus TaxID=1441469 RepID=A0A225AKW9_TALAT|nr:hypothetical protein UA08_02232 [Talaromyces atroroseus]OKL62221.1 hypothetical protein UA08_02232 [Talaromyces atroroseus]
MPDKKILIVVSDADSIVVTKSSGSSTSTNQQVQQPTGFFLMELAKPLSQILEAGYEVTFASPNGQRPVPDPNSESLMAFAGNFYERQREKDLIQRMKRENGFNSPRQFKSFSNYELDSFAGIFIPGGHAPLRDLSNDPELGRILKHFHSKGKPTAAICHGLIAFLSTRCAWEVGGEFAYKGYKLTSFSDAEEKAVETMLGGEINPKLESALAHAGAVMVEGAREKVGYITVDKEVVSGGNPLAAQDLGRQFVGMLAGAA